MKKRDHTIFLIGCSIGLSCIERALARHPDIGAELVIIDNTKELKEKNDEWLKREPIPIKPYDLFSKVEDYNEYIVTKPIDAIASRHKYPRKKNEW